MMRSYKIEQYHNFFQSLNN